MKKTSRRSSDVLREDVLREDVLREIAQDKADGELTYRHISNKLSNRTFGIALLFFALPNVLPLSTIPGFSFVFSIPIAIFAFQMIIAQKTLWLPKFIADHTIPHKKV